MVYLRDFEPLFIPTGSRCFQERALMEHYFPTNYTDFIPDRAMDPKGRFVSALVYAADGGNVFRESVFSEVTELDKMLTKDVVVEQAGSSYGWRDLCARRDDACIPNDILKLADVVKDIETGHVTLSYPFTFHPETLETVITAGNIAKPSLEGDKDVTGTKAVRLQYFLDSGSPETSLRCSVNYNSDKTQITDANVLQKSSERRGKGV
jgi:hypothetical protein